MSKTVLAFDLTKNNPLPPIINGRVGDGDSQTMTVYITENEEVVDLTGAVITFEGITFGNQTEVFDSDNVDITATGLKTGSFDYTFPNAAFAVEGKYERAYFSIVKNGKRNSTSDFEIIVLGNADIDAPVAETIITEYNKLVAELQSLQKETISKLQKQQDDYIKSSDKAFSAIQAKITEFKDQVDSYQIAVGKIATDVVTTINQALAEFKAQDFYTKLEADDRFAKTSDITKEKVGLSNVDNYGTATQEEAEAGIATNKFMTPALVFKAISQWVQGKFISATESQTILGTKNFEEVPTVNEKPLQVENFGVCLVGGGLADEAIADGTILRWGTLFSYDNDRSKNNDVFELSADNKTLTIKKSCCLWFEGRFRCQTTNINTYAYLGMRINNVNDVRVAGIAGTLNWRNDVGWQEARNFSKGDKVTLVLGTNYKVDKGNAWGVDLVHISEIIKA